MNVSFDVNLFNVLVGLGVFIIHHMFIKKLDKLQTSFEKMAERLEQYVKIQDHKEDLSEVKRRIEKLEDSQRELVVKINAPRE